MDHRRFIAVKLTLSGAAGLRSKGAQAQGEMLRIGYRKYGTVVLLKEKGTLGASCKGSAIRWPGQSFPAGGTRPQLPTGG